MGMDSNRKGPIVARGHTSAGLVVSDRSKKTIIVEIESLEYFPKYKRSARSKSRIHVHNPDSIGAKLGDTVEIAECRKISKTKAWVVTKILKKVKGIVVIDQKGGRALDEEEDRLKKSEVKRDKLASDKPEEETEVLEKRGPAKEKKE